MTKDKTVTMSLEPMLQVPRALLEALFNADSVEQHEGIDRELRALLAAPVVERQPEPVMKLEAERLWEGDGEYSVSFVKSGWLDECRRTGGTFMLYTSPPALVLPERKVGRPCASQHRAYNEGFNAAIDKVKEMNR